MIYGETFKQEPMALIKFLCVFVHEYKSKNHMYLLQPPNPNLTWEAPEILYLQSPASQFLTIKGFPQISVHPQHHLSGV